MIFRFVSQLRMSYIDIQPFLAAILGSENATQWLLEANEVL
jgi:hypothetical protein